MKKLIFLLVVTCSISLHSLELQSYENNPHPRLIKKIESWIEKLDKEDNEYFNNLLALGEVILPYLKNSMAKGYSTEVQKNIIKLIEKLQTEKSQKILIEWLEDENLAIRVREQVVVTLGNLGYTQSLPYLQKYCNVRDVRIYRASVQAICRIKTNKTIPYLIELLGHWDNEVISKVHTALVEMSNQNFSANYQVWKNWWEQNEHEWTDK